MSNNHETLLLELLNAIFNPEGEIDIIAISAVFRIHMATTNAVIKLRIELTYHDRDRINPYFDGSKLFVQITPDGFRLIMTPYGLVDHHSRRVCQ